MLNEYKLPFSDHPLAICYHNRAFPLGIIEGNAKELNKDITPWIISKFINTSFVEESHGKAYDICLFDKWGTKDKILLYQYINMFKSTYENLNIDIINYLCKLIMEGVI